VGSYNFWASEETIIRGKHHGNKLGKRLKAVHRSASDFKENGSGNKINTRSSQAKKSTLTDFLSS